jgi:hypothetical protein
VTTQRGPRGTGEQQPSGGRRWRSRGGSPGEAGQQDGRHHPQLAHKVHQGLQAATRGGSDGAPKGGGEKGAPHGAGQSSITTVVEHSTTGAHGGEQDKGPRCPAALLRDRNRLTPEGFPRAVGTQGQRACLEAAGGGQAGGGVEEAARPAGHPAHTQAARVAVPTCAQPGGESDSESNLPSAAAAGPRPGSRSLWRTRRPCQPGGGPKAERGEQHAGGAQLTLHDGQGRLPHCQDVPRASVGPHVPGRAGNKKRAGHAAGGGNKTGAPLSTTLSAPHGGPNL